MPAGHRQGPPARRPRNRPGWHRPASPRRSPLHPVVARAARSRTAPRRSSSGGQCRGTHRAGVALVLGEVVAVLGELPVVAAADHVDRDPAAVSWSSVANCLAATVGAVKPVRWAIISPSRSVTVATWAASSKASGEVEWKHQHPVEPAPFHCAWASSFKVVRSIAGPCAGGSRSCGGGRRSR